MSSFSTTEDALLSRDADPVSEAEALKARGRTDEAIALLDGVHASGRGSLRLSCARAEMRLAAGDGDGALAIAREMVQLHPGVALAAALLGDALSKKGRLAAAIAEYQRALRLDPRSARARYGLGAAWLDAGEPEKAAEAFDALDPESAPSDLAEKLAEIAAIRARPRADPRYVRHLFDQFSADYDSRMLGELHYAAPRILRQMASLIGLAARAPLSILDLGCGTGLAGAAFADLAARLDGIDLSPAMLEKAAARGIYDELRVGDLEAVSGDDGARRYDLVLAADTLVYLGDLANAFGAAAQRLGAGGLFLFTVERRDGEGFELGPKRRWRHSESYLRNQAEARDFTIAGFLDCELRTEAGVPVPGHAVALERS